MQSNIEFFEKDRFLVDFEQLKLKIENIKTSEFQIEPSAIYNYLDARLLIKKENTPALIVKFDSLDLELEQHPVSINNLNAGLEYILNNPDEKIRILFTGPHWSSALIHFLPSKNKLNCLLIDSAPLKPVYFNQSIIIFKIIQQYFTQKFNNLDCNFYYSMDELQKDLQSCASYSVHCINNLIDIEKYIYKTYIFDYLDNHPTDSAHQKTAEFRTLVKDDLKISFVHIPIKLTLTKQSLNSKADINGAMGLITAINQRESKDKDEFYLQNNKKKTIKEIYLEILDTKQPLINKKTKRMYEKLQIIIQNTDEKKLFKKVKENSILIGEDNRLNNETVLSLDDPQCSPIKNIKNSSFVFFSDKSDKDNEDQNSLLSSSFEM